MNPQSLRIIFMGTPEFAVASLEKLVKEKYNVVAVVTAPDKPAGRGKQVQQSAVKKFALENGLKILQPEKLKSPEFINELQALKPDLQVVVAFRMLPDVVWQLAPMGTFNLHASLLPFYRGAAPINRAVMNGENKTGLTTFFLQHEIDTGNIIFREETEIGENETAGELHDRLMIMGAALVVKTVDAIASGNCPKISQSTFVREGENIPTAPKIFREDCRIDWKWNAEKIFNHIRGLSPYPAAWCVLKKENGENVELKIFKTAFEIAKHNEVPGKISPPFRVTTADGFIDVFEVQAAGKKRMTAAEFLRGTSISAGDQLV